MFLDFEGECKVCGCFFSCSDDFDSHFIFCNLNNPLDAKNLDAVGWRSFKNNSGFWILKKKVPSLDRMIILNGSVTLGSYVYRISGDFITKNIVI